MSFDIKNMLVRGFLKVLGGLWAKQIDTEYISADDCGGTAFNGIKSNISALQTTTTQLNSQLAGNSVTGPLRIRRSLNFYDGVNNRNEVILCLDDGDGYNYGSELIIGAAGNTFIGSGESPHQLQNALGAKNSETMYISSDQHIEFHTNCNTIASRGTCILNNSKQFYPTINNTGSLGTASYRWGSLYAQSIYLPKSAVSWVGGKTSTNCIVANKQDTVNYWPVLRINSSSENVWNIGGLGNYVGFYGYFSSRTANGYDFRFVWDTSTGNVTCDQTITAKAHATSSSKKYKNNIKDMSQERAKEILKYHTVEFDYIDTKQGENCMGLIAEEVAEIDTYPVVYNGNEIEGLDYSKFVPQLIKMVQIQQREIDELKKILSDQT